MCAFTFLQIVIKELNLKFKIKENPHGIKRETLSYSIAFKIEVMNYTEKHGNRAAERHFGSPLTEMMIQEWRKQRKDLIKADNNKKLYVHVLLNGQNLKNMLRTR